MNLSHLNEHYEELLSYMEQKGYSNNYIIRFRKEIQRILSKADPNDWTAYLDIYKDYEKVPHSKDYLRNKRTIIGAIEQFDLRGLLPDGRRIRSCSYRKNISAVFRAGLNRKEKECRIILSFLPMLREKRQNIQYLTETEVMIIRETTTNGTLSYRNTAIIRLLLYTGLRACDISGLMTDSIDWELETVKICRQKTEMPLELPLSPVVGNAIFDCLHLERPDSKDPHLFLSVAKHYTPLKSGSISNIVSKYLLTSGIRQNAGDRKGTHIFRHNLAATLLGNGVPRPVISETLGHTASDSLEPYLRADFIHLKECALSIRDFPVLEEVFDK